MIEFGALLIITCCVFGIVLLAEGVVDKCPTFIIIGLISIIGNMVFIYEEYNVYKQVLVENKLAIYNSEGKFKLIEEVK